MLKIGVCVSLSVVGGIASTGMAAATLYTIAVPPGGITANGYALSADGTVATGYAETGMGVEAIRWTVGGGTTVIGRVPGSTSTVGSAISGDGQTIVGRTFIGSNARAFRWTQPDGFVDLGTLPNTTTSYADFVSFDGNKVLGWGYTATGQRAFQWTPSGGLQDLGTVIGDPTVYTATGMSRDGNVIVGNNPLGAFKWSSTLGTVSLTSPAGAYKPYASGVSGDGSVVFGSYGTPFENRPVRWTSSGQREELGLLPGVISATPNASSDDGSVIVGEMYYSSTRPDTFIWSPSLGLLDLKYFLPSQGIDLTGWDLRTANSVSADGSTILGLGMYNGELTTWIATGLTIPSPVAALPLFLVASIVRRRR